MLIKLRFFCIELPLENRTFELEIPQDSTVEKALEIFAQSYEGKFQLNTMNSLTFLINNKNAMIDSVLSQGDQITVLQILTGG